MKKIYICTEGCYSDYSIRGVFDDKGLADAFAEMFGCTVEEWALNPHKKGIKSGHTPYRVRMAKNGDVLGVEKLDSAYGLSGEESDESGFDYKKNMYAHCFAKDETHAVKIANERRAALIAGNQWPEVQR